MIYDYQPSEGLRIVDHTFGIIHPELKALHMLIM